MFDGWVQGGLRDLLGALHGARGADEVPDVHQLLEVLEGGGVWATAMPKDPWGVGWRWDPGDKKGHGGPSDAPPPIEPGKKVGPNNCIPANCWKSAHPSPQQPLLVRVTAIPNDLWVEGAQLRVDEQEHSGKWAE